MKSVVYSILVAGLLFGVAFAQDLGNSRELPDKNTPVVIYEPPAVPRQGGDTIFDATVIPGLPYSNTGTTDGYVNDYDESCPYSGSLSPVVVYSFTPDGDVSIDVDLCGSGYDTKVYIYDEDLHLIDCNDDAYFYDDPCGVYVSKLENVALLGGVTHYIVIDGYGGYFGPYVLNIEEREPCFVFCPEDAVPEGEPPLHDGYQDAYNGGCNSPEFGYPFQAVNWTNDEDGIPPYDGEAWMCGRSGWYLNPVGLELRDTDWFRVFARETGMMEVTVESEFPCYIFVLGILDCNLPVTFLWGEADCGAPVTLTFPMEAGQEEWLWVGPAAFSGPVTEFTYFMTVSNNTFDTVPAKGMSWGGVKSLYR
jgi:hypothetical protein